MGMNEYTTKPFDKSVILQLIEKSEQLILNDAPKNKSESVKDISPNTSATSIQTYSGIFSSLDKSTNDNAQKLAIQKLNEEEKADTHQPQ